jgi:hypothetical protein
MKGSGRDCKPRILGSACVMKQVRTSLLAVVSLLLVVGSFGGFDHAMPTYAQEEDIFVYLPLIMATGAAEQIWRPFSDDSLWNTPLGDAPPIDPNSSVYIQQINNFYQSRTGSLGAAPIMPVREDWGVGLYFIEDLDPYPPLVNVCSHWVPVPSYAQPDPSSDAHLCIIDRDTGEEWDFWAFSGSYPSYTCGTSGVMDVFSDGVRAPHASAARESGTPLIAGLIRPEEIQAGEIHHALAYAFDARNSLDWRYFVTPASSGAGNDFGPDGDHVLPMGARLQLRPEVDISGLTPAAQVIATTLQEYGMYLVEESDGTSLGIYMQTVGDEDGDGTVEYWNDLWGGIWTMSDQISLTALNASDFRVIELPPLAD